VVVDIDAFNTYVQIRVSVGTLENGKEWFYNFGIRHCTVKDYTRRGVKMNEKLEKKIRTRICADIPENFNYFGVKNEDSNEDS
jgi:uncharacterized protein YxeA